MTMVKNGKKEREGERDRRCCRDGEEKQNIKEGTGEENRKKHERRGRIRTGAWRRE